MQCSAVQCSGRRVALRRFAMSDLTGLAIGVEARKRNGSFDAERNVQVGMRSSRARTHTRVRAHMRAHAHTRTRLTHLCCFRARAWGWSGQDWLLEQGRQGMKNGKGWYDYSKDMKRCCLCLPCLPPSSVLPTSLLAQPTSAPGLTRPRLRRDSLAHVCAAQVRQCSGR